MLHGILYAEMSALQNINVSEIFRNHIQFIYKMQKKAVNKLQLEKTNTKKLGIPKNPAHKNKKGGSCTKCEN